MRRRLLSIGVAVLALLSLSACNLSLAQDVTPPPGYVPPTFADPLTSLEGVFPANQPDAAAGAEIYALRCMPCHGETGAGDGPQAAQLPTTPAAIGNPEVAAASSPVVWFSIVTNGNLDNFMPPFANALSEQERWDVLAYVYSLGQTAEQIETGEDVFVAECSECHTPAEFADAERTVQISNAEWAELIRVGVPQAMPAYAGELTEEEIAAVLAYMRAQVFLPFVVQVAAPVATETPVTEATPVASAGAADVTPEALVEETAPAGVRVAGQVLNGTTGEPASGATVTLYGYDHTTQVLTLTTTSDADGQFVFEGLEDVVQRLFFVTADHMDMTYGSDFVQVAELGVPEYGVAVTVFDTSTDASVLNIARLHVFLEFPEPDLLQVVELLVLSNPSNFTVVPAGAGQSVYAVPLPEGASGLIFQEGALGARFVSTADGFGDTQPVLPGEGETQLLFAYQLPYTRGLDLTLPLSMNVADLLVFVPPDSVQLESERLADGGLQDLNGVPYQLYAGEDFTTGESVLIELSGRHPLAAGGFQLAESSPTSLILGGLGLLFTLIGLGLWWRERRTIADEEDEENAEELLDAILALEEAYERGDLDTGTFENQRQVLKKRLADLVAE